MPQGGNFGGASIPDTVVGLDILFAERLTTYKDYSCTQIVATASSATFKYQTAGGVAVTFSLPAAGDTLDLIVDPKLMSATGSNGVALCYKCNCYGPMTGSTVPFVISGDSIAQAQGAFAPTIIGGGGLNN